MAQRQGAGKIETCHWSWNPVKGRCGFAQAGNACDYCWAERLFKRNLPFMAPGLRLNEKELSWSPRSASRIAVCYSLDLFHPLVPGEWIDRILEKVAAKPKNVYQFLTKCSWGLYGHSYPDNAWVGTTVDGTRRTRSNAHNLAQSGVDARIKYIFFEPLIKRPDYMLHLANDDVWESIRWVVVGADSSRGAVAPPVEWATSLVERARSKGIAVYVKDNYRGYPDPPKEFPEG